MVVLRNIIERLLDVKILRDRVRYVCPLPCGGFDEGRYKVGED